MDCCDHCHVPDPHRGNTGYRRVLWAVLAINAAMFWSKLALASRLVRPHFKRTL